MIILPGGIVLIVHVSRAIGVASSETSAARILEVVPAGPAARPLLPLIRRVEQRLELRDLEKWQAQP